MNGLGARIVGAVGLVGSLLAACGGSGATKADGGGGIRRDRLRRLCPEGLRADPGLRAGVPFNHWAPECGGVRRELPSRSKTHWRRHTQAIRLRWSRSAGTSWPRWVAPISAGQNGFRLSSPRRDDPERRSATPPGNVRADVAPYLAVVLNGSISCGTCVPSVPWARPVTRNGLLGSDCADNLVCAVMTVGGTRRSARRLWRSAAPARTPGSVRSTPFATGPPTFARSSCLGQACDPRDLLLRPHQGRGPCDANSSLCKPITLVKAGSPVPCRPTTRPCRASALATRRQTQGQTRGWAPAAPKCSRASRAPTPTSAPSAPLAWAASVPPWPAPELGPRKRRRHERRTAGPQRLCAAKPHPHVGSCHRVGVLAAALTRSGVI